MDIDKLFRTLDDELDLGEGWKSGGCGVVQGVGHKNVNDRLYSKGIML
jgi:hypothetical protein